MKLEAEFESGAGAPRKARDLIRHEAIDLVPAATLADVLTVVTELIDNAVRHGEGDRTRLLLEVSDDGIRGEVESGGHAEIEYVTPHPQDLRGLGLHIVNSIASDWGIDRSNGGVTVVKFEVAFPTPDAGPSARQALERPDPFQ